MSTLPATKSAVPPGIRPSPVSRFADALFNPIDIAMIVVFRVAFGACMAIEVYRFFSHGWITSQFVRPPVHFKYFGFGWVGTLNSAGMHALFAVLGVCAVCIAVGFLYRFAATLFALGFTYVFLQDQTFYLNHFYLIVLLSFISMVLPANRKWSVDAWLRPSIRSESAPAWTLWLLRFQLAIPYFFGGIAKLNPDWLSGVPMQIMMGSGENYPLLGRFFDRDMIVHLFAWGGVAFDLLIVPSLLWSRTRVPAYLGAVLFHASNARMFRIGIFPLVMVAASTLFFPPEWIRPRPPEVSEAVERRRRESPRLTRGQNWTLAALALFATFQVLMPLRHFLYPGDVSWTEEGHRFSWHMKLRTKTAVAVFHAFDERGRELSSFTSPERILSQRQWEVMCERPDMLLQYAHRIRRQLAQQGYRGVRVHVDVKSKLNGRQPQTLIDPNVDLAATPRNLRHATWIVPLSAPIPTLSAVREEKRARAAGGPDEMPPADVPE